MSYHQVDAPSPRRSRAIDPQMRPLRWAKRPHSRETRLYRVLRRELIQHVGGQPTPAQRALIDRLAWLQLHLAIMDERMVIEGMLSDHASRQYLAWANAVSRMLQALGLQSPSPNLQSAQTNLADYLSAKAGR